MFQFHAADALPFKNLFQLPRRRLVPVHFSFQRLEGAHNEPGEVFLVGSWGKGEHHQLQRNLDGVYNITVMVPPGHHSFKVIKNGCGVAAGFCDAVPGRRSPFATMRVPSGTMQLTPSSLGNLHGETAKQGEPMQATPAEVSSRAEPTTPSKLLDASPDLADKQSKGVLPASTAVSCRVKGALVISLWAGPGAWSDCLLSRRFRHSKTGCGSFCSQHDSHGDLVCSALCSRPPVRPARRDAAGSAAAGAAT
jgi:hypothetical protein